MFFWYHYENMPQQSSPTIIKHPWVLLGCNTPSRKESRRILNPVQIGPNNGTVVIRMKASDFVGWFVTKHSLGNCQIVDVPLGAKKKESRREQRECLLSEGCIGP